MEDLTRIYSALFTEFQKKVDPKWDPKFTEQAWEEVCKRAEVPYKSLSQVNPVTPKHFQCYRAIQEAAKKGRLPEDQVQYLWKKKCASEKVSFISLNRVISEIKQVKQGVSQNTSLFISPLGGELSTVGVRLNKKTVASHSLATKHLLKAVLKKSIKQLGKQKTLKIIQELWEKE